MQGQYLQITSSIHGQKKPKNAPLHPLRVKWWGQKHIGSSYFCELSLHTEFQSPSTSPSGRKVTTWKEEEERRRENNDENNGYLLYVDTSRARAKRRQKGDLFHVT